MSYRVAVASSDGKFVNQHFGHAEQFLIFEIAGDDCQYIETRVTDPLCDDLGHDEDRLSGIVRLLDDCRAVLVAKIGPGALDQLQARGIQAIAIPRFIDDALYALIASNKLKQQ
jgi:predicted Fe-Mo cluster-binding NifX family protein